MRATGRRAHRAELRRRELRLQLEHDPLSRLLSDPRNRLEPGDVLERDRSPQLGGRRAGDDRKRDLGPDPVERDQVLGELALLPVAETVERERVLAHVQMRLDRQLIPALSRPQRGSRRVDAVPDPAHLEDEVLARTADGASTQPRNHPATRSSGGASA